MSRQANLLDGKQWLTSKEINYFGFFFVVSMKHTHIHTHKTGTLTVPKKTLKNDKSKE